MTASLGIQHTASPLQEEIVRFIYQFRAAHGKCPSLRKIADHLGWKEQGRSKNLRYHMHKMVRLGHLEATLEQQVYEAGRQAETARLAGATHGCGVARRQGSCPDRARQIARLLISDSHAVDRFARLFSGEWQKGVAL